MHVNGDKITLINSFVRTESDCVSKHVLFVLINNIS